MEDVQPKAETALAQTVPKIAVAALLAATLWLTQGQTARASALSDCISDDSPRRIEGCTALIDEGGLSDRDRSLAHAMRALAFSLQGQYHQALPDYSRAIELDSGAAVALNNRAWVRFRMKDFSAGLEDVEQALSIDPASSHALDTRAHIRHSLGDASGALTDYEQAMRFGGERSVKLYQCGLQAQGLYAGLIHGIYMPDMRSALRACVRRRDCDPLPPDEECRNATS